MLTVYSCIYHKHSGISIEKYKWPTLSRKHFWGHPLNLVDIRVRRELRLRDIGLPPRCSLAFRSSRVFRLVCWCCRRFGSDALSRNVGNHLLRCAATPESEESSLLLLLHDRSILQFLGLVRWLDSDAVAKASVVKCIWNVCFAILHTAQSFVFVQCRIVSYGNKYYHHSYTTARS